MSAITDIIAGGTDSSGPTPVQYQTWQPAYTSGMDTSFNTAVGNLTSAANTASPYWNQYLASVTNNPYQSGAQTASNQAGAAYTNVGNQAIGNANALSGASNAILNSSMDPQSSLYNYNRQANTDTTNAALAARGLNSSALGASLAGQSDIDFNNQWLNNQLSRQTQGLNAAQSGFSSAGTIGTGGASALNMGGAVPLSTYNAGNNALASGLSNYGSGISSLNTSALSPMLSYLGLAANQSNAQGNFDQQYWQNQMEQTQLENNLNNMMWGGVGNLLGAGLGALGGMGGSSGVLATSGPAAGQMVVPTF